MGLRLTLLDSGLYEAEATPPHVKGVWSTSEPMDARSLVNELQARGCHQQDIGDALADLDPDWLSKL